jgi:hypothetical protein
MLEELAKAHAAAELRFFNEHTVLSERTAFTAFLRPLRRLGGLCQGTIRWA